MMLAAFTGVAACMGWLIWNVQVVRERRSAIAELAASLVGARLETEADVQAVVANAARSRRAIMFVHVDWAIMEPQRTRFAQFVVEYQRMYPNDGVLFHYVDCTSVTDGYAPLKALPGWQELENTEGTSLIHGWGELVWLEQGRVLHVERTLNFDTTSDLLQKTRRLILAQESG
jgi:hypothetical protein